MRFSGGWTSSGYSRARRPRHTCHSTPAGAPLLIRSFLLQAFETAHLFQANRIRRVLPANLACALLAKPASQKKRQPALNPDSVAVRSCLRLLPGVSSFLLL